MQIGFTELLLIIFLIIALFKPSKLKEIAAYMGTLYRQVADMKQDLSDSVLNADTSKEERSNESNEDRIS